MRLAAFLFLLLAPAAASATQVLALDLRQIAAESDAVVWGRVTDVQAEPVPETPRRTHTRVLVAVHQWVGGREPAVASVELSLPGGQVGRYAQLVAGTPKVRRGDEVVVALARGEDGRLRVVGFNQGIWQVTRGPLGVTVASSDRRGAELLQQGPGGVVRATPVPDVHTTTLDALLTELRAALAAVPR